MLTKIEKLPDWLVDSVDRNTGVVWQAVKAYRANLRQGTVGVKTRALVKSTGKKPYEQKKTGNARRGSFVSPICVGGGVAHGPKARSYRQATPDKMQRLALKIALAKRMMSGNVFSGDLKVTSGKTKDACALVNAAYGRVGKTIICLDSHDDISMRAYRNLRGVVLLPAVQLNVLDVIESRNLVLSHSALKVLEERLLKA